MTVSSSGLRILHVVDDFSTHNTGVTASVRQLSGWQVAHCDWVGVHTTGEVDLLAPKGVQVTSSTVHPLTPNWRYPVEGVAPLLKLINKHRVTHLHVHEFWRAGYVLGMRASAKSGIPVVLSAHGLASPAALANKGWRNLLKKQVYWNLFARWYLPSCVGLHAITSLEALHLSSFMGRAADAVIPNAIDLDDPLFRQTETVTSPRKEIVFLGRLHPIKGVDVLIEAFSRSNLDQDWELLLIGPEEVPVYAERLKALAAASPRAAKIRFIGSCHGEAKRDFLSRAWVVVVPSHTEVVGMVNLEAASLFTPTITTYATGLTTWLKSGGLLADPEPVSVMQALETAAGWSLSERMQRGVSARRFVEREFSLETVGQAWLRFYVELLKQDCT